MVAANLLANRHVTNVRVVTFGLQKATWHTMAVCLNPFSVFATVPNVLHAR